MVPNVSKIILMEETLNVLHRLSGVLAHVSIVIDTFAFVLNLYLKSMLFVA